MWVKTWKYPCDCWFSVMCWVDSVFRLSWGCLFFVDFGWVWHRHVEWISVYRLVCKFSFLSSWQPAWWVQYGLFKASSSTSRPLSHELLILSLSPVSLWDVVEWVARGRLIYQPHPLVFKEKDWFVIFLMQGRRSFCLMLWVCLNLVSGVCGCVVLGRRRVTDHPLTTLPPPSRGLRTGEEPVCSK